MCARDVPTPDHRLDDFPKPFLCGSIDCPSAIAGAEKLVEGRRKMWVQWHALWLMLGGGNVGLDHESGQDQV